MQDDIVALEQIQSFFFEGALQFGLLTLSALSPNTFCPFLPQSNSVASLAAAFTLPLCEARQAFRALNALPTQTGTGAKTITMVRYHRLLYAVCVSFRRDALNFKFYRLLKDPPDKGGVKR